MKCPICKHGETKEGKTTVTLERNGIILVFKSVPAEICTNCEEEYVNEATTKKLLASAENTIRDGVQLDVLEFKAA